VISDIHEPAQAEPAAKVLDVIQIPAFLARQTDLIIAAAKTKKPLHIKKAQFMAPGEMGNVVKKALAGGANKIMLCERGTFFGYHNLVVDFRSLQTMAELGWPVVFDATHSVQRPAGQGQASGGDKKFIPLLCRAAVAAGVDGLFIETHPDPQKALSDGPNSWPLSELEVLLKSLITIKNAVGKGK
jgi:2-dehydro-3-deoxyphosphooctonate aldolase (KDO 8-P synthase)